MLVCDLDPCPDLTHSGNIGGGLGTDNTHLLSIIDRWLLLSFGRKPLGVRMILVIPNQNH